MADRDTSAQPLFGHRHQRTARDASAGQLRGLADQFWPTQFWPTQFWLLSPDQVDLAVFGAPGVSVQARSGVGSVSDGLPCRPAGPPVVVIPEVKGYLKHSLKLSGGKCRCDRTGRDDGATPLGEGRE